MRFHSIGAPFKFEEVDLIWWKMKSSSLKFMHILLADVTRNRNIFAYYLITCNRYVRPCLLYHMCPVNINRSGSRISCMGTRLQHIGCGWGWGVSTWSYNLFSEGGIVVSFGSSIRNLIDKKILFSNGAGGRTAQYVAKDYLLLS